MKINHLASFSGNIGDVVNHFSFRNWFNSLIGPDIEWSEIEIRDFYRKRRFFDESFVDLVNSADLLVIGGGNFLELWPTSRTGTSIDLPISLLDRIKVPIFWNSLGIDDGQGIGDNAKDNFSRFLEYILSRKDFLFSVRNDGSYKNLTSHFQSFANKDVPILPDHGFFISESLKIAKAKKDVDFLRVGINLACDMTTIRYGSLYDSNFHKFCEELAKVLNSFPDIQLKLIPHVYSDLEIFSELLKYLDDTLRRSNLEVVGLQPKVDGLNTILEAYNSIDLMLAMRFHANLIPFSYCIPTFGLSNYPQISKMYDESTLGDYCIDLKNPLWTDNLKIKLLDFFQNTYSINKDFERELIKMKDKREVFGRKLISWIDHFVL